MEDFGTYLSAVVRSWAALLASAGVVVVVFLLKHTAPKLYSDWAKGDRGRIVLVVGVAGGVLVAGYSAWHAPYKELKQLKQAEKQAPKDAKTPSHSPVVLQAPTVAPVYAAEPAAVSPARATDAQINARIDKLLLRASSIEAAAGSFRGPYDQEAAATQITGWQTEAAVFLRNDIGPEAERDFRTVTPVAPNTQAGALLNGSATTAVGMFTAQREVLNAYRR
jgi:hypothetical protein